MTAVVFAGPTLSAKAVAAHLDATVLPPVRQGDVYRVTRDKPSAIGIIDGYFEGVPSVWHKEILWAMEQGIPVFGSASMGALRAAELADFGMIGVGRIFDDYHSGVLQDDDEVAVLHGPAELGYPSLSVPMVSIRTTVERARAEGVLSDEGAQTLLRVSKETQYKKRQWEGIVKALTGGSEITSFMAWLPNGYVDAKAEDALAMLVQMAQGIGDDTSHSHRTERTLMWNSLRRRVEAETPSDPAVINELRLQPALFAEVRDRALLHVLARDEAHRRGQTPDRDALVQQMTAHRDRANLTRHADLMRWLDANDLSPNTYEDMLADAARLSAVSQDRGADIEAPLLNELRRAGIYSQLRDRATAKAELQATAPLTTGSDRLRMVLWYFETHLDQEVPDDLESYARSLGLSGRDAFYELIETEYLYCQKAVTTDDSNHE
ncbi:TfuA-like protein [Ruegeria lacuscaerulensis]|uniref:TfuA-like protein n=1 Tax=Ruegeria lacuscaerulensis TaxID=55218 RepID=UPI00147E8AF1|nr:TfuA-like protein [Ruegeria lacuscaerulensis]